jgi:signal transduction histidine kinase
MSLRNKLLLSTVTQALLVIVVSVFLVVSSRQIVRANDNDERAAQIVATITQMRFAAFENLLHHNERSFEQWQAKHNSLLTLLEPVDTQGTEERTILDEIKKLALEESTLFKRLNESITSGGNPNADARQQLETRLATQVMIKQQGQISQAFSLSELARNEREQLARQERRLVGLVIATMLGITVVNFLFITRTITRALKALQAGAQKIASGQFAYRIPSDGRDDEFGRLTTAFNSMAADLGQIDKVKSEFILLASHQLRTPLTAIKWYSKALVSSSAPLPDDKKEHYLSTIHASNERMIDLVNNLLSASKIELGNLAAKPERVQLAIILDQVLQDVAAQIREKKISVGKNISRSLPTVRIDPTWARVIFQNLLSNAIKYSKKGEHVQVTLKKRDDNFLIIVSDEGYGIPADQHEKIFDKLFRANNAQMGGDGSGLGLYITKAMVEQAAGRIWFESTENQGSVFYVELPVQKDDTGNKV